MDNNMPRMSVSLSKETMKELKTIAKKENRPYSRQIEHMLKFYLENKD